MCGIAGFTHRKHAAAERLIREATGSLAHRGPDQRGVFNSARVSLGAARLKIIDLHGGDQPIVSETGNAVIVFNGEIYNHAEIRGELEARGHRFRSRSDTETVLEAFLEWDIAAFARLRGMFAVALWSEAEKRLVLARDRMGIKPLFMARRAGEIYFGSELKTIFVHPQIERCLDPAALDCYLSLNYVPGPMTLVEGVEKLEPGHWLEWREGVVREGSYWSLPPDCHLQRDPPEPWTVDSAKEKLDALLKDSLREHLVSDVPLGLWLSGGLDSSTILHYAAAAAGEPLRTFSISFRGRSFDESAYIREVASRYGTRHEELDLNPDSDLEGAISQLADYADEPVADAGALPVWFLSGLTRRHATVAFSGEGADELFGGYLTYRANNLARIARRVPGVLRSLAGQAAKLWPVSDDKIGFEYKLKRFLRGCEMAPARAHVFWNGTFSDESKSALTAEPLPGALNRLLGALSGAGDRLNSYLVFDQRYFLPDDILAKVDRMSMAHSIEVRPPFLDHRIVEFAASLPPEMKVRGASQKVILRELMKDKLPASVLRRPKTGFDIPAHEWLRGPLRTMLLDTIAWGAEEHGYLFRASVINAHVARHMARRANLGYHLWGLMILFLWMRKWRIQSCSLPEPARLHAAARV